jgi:predicted nucleic-acid-binding Zn-ribbon protein
MKEIRCPKCNGEMDEGRVGTGEDLRYTSNRQTGMIRTTTPVRRARACLTCGYVELYLDAAELNKKLK